MIPAPFVFKHPSGATVFGRHGSLTSLVPEDIDLEVDLEDYDYGSLIEEVEVPDSERGGGIGTKLVCSVQQKLSSYGCEIVICYALPEAERFWSRLGYSYLTKSNLGSWMFREI